MKLCPYCYNPLSSADVDRLQAENEKLRELVRGLEVCADEYADARTDCPLYDEGEPHRCVKERVKRELGIEVGA